MPPLSTVNPDPEIATAMEMNPAAFENPQDAPAVGAVTAIEEALVLVVDDSRTMRLALTRELNKLGFTRIAEAVAGRMVFDPAELPSQFAPSGVDRTSTFKVNDILWPT